MGETGRLFVFEGVDGSGKTTLSRAFVDHASAMGFDCAWMSFPGCENGTLGKLIYDLHHNGLGRRVGKICPTSLQLLHVAAHVDAIEQRILPALSQGRLVVLDRYWWSTLVYGLVAGANQQSLLGMIRIEQEHWGRVHPACVFMVRRCRPPGETHTLEGDLLEREYAKLAAREGQHYKVCSVDNSGTVDATTKNLIAIAKLEVARPPRCLDQSLRELTSKCSTSGRMAQPHIFSKLTPAKSTAVYDTYWRFAAERQAVFFRRVSGDNPPWTSDPILLTYKFTNAYRASDRTSQYLIRKVLYDGEQTPNELFFRTILFKLFNRIETWELLNRILGRISWSGYSFARYDAVLTKAMDDGEAIYSGAYIMPSGRSGSSGERKHRMHLKLVEQMLADNLPARLGDAASMGQAFEMLRAYPTIGDFLAYQFVTDVNYSTLTNFTEMEFVVPGPGARDGIRKCFSDLGGLTEADIIKVVTERQDAEFDRLGLKFQSLWGRPLQLIDCQNLFCEVDKYSRVRHPEFVGLTGRTRIKQRYQMDPSPIAYWYPPKWGVNERIEKGR